MAKEIYTVNFVKPGIQNRRSTPLTSHDIQLAEMFVGGAEGAKSDLYIIDPISKKTRGRMVAKEYKDNNQGSFERVEKIVDLYSEMRKKGYPVPESVRYFDVKSTNSRYLAMSDMREQGKYLFWGYNDYSNEDENRELLAMKLTHNNLNTIKDGVYRLVNMAYKDGYFLRSYYYHVRKKKETGELDVVLLDLPADFLAGNNKLALFGEADSFKAKLRGTILSRA